MGFSYSCAKAVQAFIKKTAKRVTERQINKPNEQQYLVFTKQILSFLLSLPESADMSF